MASLDLKYSAVRSLTRSLVTTLSAEDQMLQSCKESSPTKWHQAHTTWFFETFVLRPFLAGYQPFDEEFHRFFNAYYLSLGEGVVGRHCAPFSRPTLGAVTDFREHVDREMTRLLKRPMNDEVRQRVLLGLHHEQQHQELLLTDIKHAFFVNPLRPAYRAGALSQGSVRHVPDLRWFAHEGGSAEIGHAMDGEDVDEFCPAQETPRHTVLLQPFLLASREVTCREYLTFVLDGGYERPESWLDEGWEATQRVGWEAPLYWMRDRDDPTGWSMFTLHGSEGLSGLLDTPVCHVSFFEAHAYARWRGCRLPTEAEWEVMAAPTGRGENVLDAGRLHPAMASGDGLEQMFGDCWEWTESIATEYPGSRAGPEALGEDSARSHFRSMVTRGGSCVTPKERVRTSYRHFLSPELRWQFAGIRLAR